ncbi:MAG: sodium:proton antiporter [Coriobacteriales bacterium]|jgi:CPA1 family monovalent cation:H+ antiporter|nr:sodium:proton antiporter [Coriobacteriales bacterium]
MHSFEFILILLVAALASSFIGARFPHVSTPLVQIAAGIVLTLLPLDFDVQLDPELFMVLFIAPLLFHDATRMNRPALWRLKYPVLLLALGLVFCTVLILGFAVNLFAPSIPLAAAFALAAALAPTDAVSVASLKQTAKISGEQDKLLQGESLLNDASSIVSFNFAIAAVVTGTFSIWQAEGVFLLQFLGGLALGVVVMLARYGLIRFLRSRGMESVSFHVLFELVTPFLVYLLAELVGVSGIIAVVAAGIAHGLEPRAITPSSARLNVVSSSVWSVFAFTLNGLVFLILGSQLPYVVERVWTGTAANTNYLLVFVVFILIIILVLRFLWLLVMRRNVHLAQSDEPVVATGSLDDLSDEAAGASTVDALDGYPGADKAFAEEASFSTDFANRDFVEREAALEEHVALKKQEHKEAHLERRKAKKAARRASIEAAHADKHYWKLHLTDSLLLSFSGVKGAITLAVIFSVPLTLDGVTPFPERDLLIFLASGVILLSLLAANFLVPFIAPRKKQARMQEEAELQATLNIYRKVIAELSASAEEDERSAVSEVVRHYYHRIASLKANNSLQLPNETQVRHYIVELQLENTQRLTDLDKVSSLTAYYYIDLLSRQLARIEHHNSLRWELHAFVDQFVHRWRMHKGVRKARQESGKRDRLVVLYDLHSLQLANYRYVIETLENTLPSDEYPAYTVDLIKKEMKQHLVRLEDRWGRDGTTLVTARKDQSAIIAVEARALECERQAIQQAFETGAISDETAKMLRDNVALMELDIEEQLE